VNTTITEKTGSRLVEANKFFGLFTVATGIVFWKTLAALTAYSVHNESGSHIILMPVVIVYFVFKERQRIFSSIRPSVMVGVCIILTGGALYWAAIQLGWFWSGNESLSAATLAFTLVLAGGFVCCYGLAAARAAAFPLFLLAFMVPVPDGALAWIIHVLQQGSTEVAYLLFRAADVPVLRQGFVLSVPGVSIEVASECSGIRSSIALLITCLLAAHLYLRTPWKIALFVLLVLPVSVIKNGIRIATLTLLSIYVDPGFLQGNLHREGGVVFFLLALLILYPALVVLEKSERMPASQIRKLPVREISSS
jgi:exosortase